MHQTLQFKLLGGRWGLNPANSEPGLGWHLTPIATCTGDKKHLLDKRGGQGVRSPPRV